MSNMALTMRCLRMPCCVLRMERGAAFSMRRSDLTPGLAESNSELSLAYIPVEMVVDKLFGVRVLR